MIGAAGQSIWIRCAKALGHAEWCDDVRFSERGERIKHRAELEEKMQVVLHTETTAHWAKVLDDAGVPCGPVNNYEQLFNDPQTVHRKMVVHVEDPELGSVAHVRTPIRMGESVQVRHVAPRLGEHNDDVFGALGVDAEKLAALRKTGVV